MPQRPWMPLYIADYLADTAHLDAQQSGAYLHLIMHYWMHGRLPDDDAQLARIAKISPYIFRKIRGEIQKFFGPGWTHKRIDAEMARAAEIREKRAASGRASAQRKRSKPAPQTPTSVATQPQQNAGILQLQLQGEKDPPNGGSKKRERGTRIPDDWKPDIDVAMSFGFSQAQAENLAASFFDHFVAAPGQKGVKRDWLATWRNWCRTEAKWRDERRGKRVDRPESGVDALGRALAESRERQREIRGGAGDPASGSGLATEPAGENGSGGKIIDLATVGYR